MKEKINPVYTLENKCHDCYKCVRECFVKSIQVIDNQAKIIEDKCIACGHCVRVCPQGAKKVRNDIDKVIGLIASGKKVIASLAPSWAGVFDYNEAEITNVLLNLGFFGVSETALGAESVSIQTSKILNNMENGLLISSACPVVVDYIRLYKPQFAPYITNLGSPLLTHCKFLREKYGRDIKIVFIGPCIAKKNEADKNPDLLDAALTFDELNFWLKQNEQTPQNGKGGGFIPYSAHEGGLYPIEGGMNETIKLTGVKGVKMVSLSSLPALERALANLDVKNIKGKIFLEALSCVGGCVSGPGIQNKKSGLLINSNILSKIKTRDNIPKNPDVVCEMEYPGENVETNEFSYDDIQKAMKSIGKINEEDELNCGGCGYSTCRELAFAILNKKAEPSMCVSYMRKLAAKKAANLLAAMPSAMVTVNKNLEIIEANNAFVKMFMGDMADVFSDTDELKGANIDRILPFYELFETVINQNTEIKKERYKIENRLFDISIFPVEEISAAGAIITDVTTNEYNREKVAKKAKEVINKNIETVQNIAGLLGEHMVEVETLLNSIAEDFSDGEK